MSDNSIDIKRSSAYGYVKSITCHVNQTTMSYFEENRVIARESGNKLLADAYEYALDKVQHTAGQFLDECTIRRSRFVASCERRLNVSREEAEVAWNQFCRAFTA